MDVYMVSDPCGLSPQLYNEIKSEDIVIKQEDIDIGSDEYRTVNVLPTELEVKNEGTVTSDIKQECKPVEISSDGDKTDNILPSDKVVKSEEIEIKSEHISVETSEYRVVRSTQINQDVMDPKMSSWTNRQTLFKGENCHHSRLKLPSWLKKNTSMTSDLNKGNRKSSDDGKKGEKKSKLWTTDRKLLNEGKRSKCSECSKGFNKQDNLLFHIIKVHKKLKPYECLKCSKPFLCKKSYMLHTESCRESFYECSECDKTFNLRSSLSRHILMDHIHPNSSSSNCPHKCEACGSYYKSKSTLYQHFLSVHSEIQHSCSDCNRYFSCKGSLSRHMHQFHKK